MSEHDDLVTALEPGRLLRRLFDALPGIVTVASLDGPTVYVNPAARRALGIGPDEPIDSLLDFRPPGFARHLRDVIVATAAREGVWRGETDFVRRSGEAFRVAQVVVVHAPARGDTYVLACPDVAASLDAGARDAEARTRFALDAARAGVWEANLRTGRVDWSESMRAVQGFSGEEFAGTLDSFLSLVHPDDQPAVHRAMHPDVDHARDFDVEFRSLWPDGTTHWVEVRGRVIAGEDGQPERILAMAQDVSERKQLETELRHAQKMEAIGQLAGGLAHDFNNLLTAIMGYAALLEADLGERDPRRPDVEEIVKAGERAAQLTRQLLAFGRRQVLQPVRIDLNALIRDLSRMLGRLIGEHITLVQQLQGRLDLIRADRGQVEQVLVNLVVNARDAMDHGAGRGGTLTVSTASIDLGDPQGARRLQLDPGRYVVLSVSDTGVGMNDETRARIFEPFFTTKDRSRGTGLGLSTVFGIVHQSGGAIDVTSEPGRGARFDVYLPVAAGSVVATTDAEPSGTSVSGSETVLLVEDDDSVRHVALEILTRRGYRVLTARHAEEALELATDDRQIDLVLTDVAMPGTSGPDLWTELRDRRPGLRVLFMSGFAEEAIAPGGPIEAGAAFIQKPFTGFKLLRKVRDVLDGARPAAE